MKIVVIVRTRDEEKNIEKFCASYQWADKILVADGGSCDNTIAIALQQPRTRVKNFRPRVQMENGLWRNSAAEHIHYLLEWANLYRPDWIIFDDCDSVPNKLLQSQGRSIFETTALNYIFAVRLHLYGKEKCFPEMSQKKKEWQPGLWAWRASENLEFKTNPVNHTHEITNMPEDKQTHKLYPPYCLLHNSWPNEEEIKKKMNFYKMSGQHPDIRHPLEFGGKLEKLPEWAI